MKIRLLVISLLVLGLIFFPVFVNLTLSESRIYYSIDYNVQVSNREEIISKAESLNYKVYLNDYIDRGAEFKSFIDADSIRYFKGRVENDTKFHWEVGYGHHLSYLFLAENHSKLYLTYNNNTIINVKDQNNQSLLSLENYHWMDIAWYLNFTQLSYAYSDKTTILLSDVIFIEMRLDYDYHCGSLCALWYSIDQYVLLSPSLDALMIFIPYRGVIVS